MAKAKPQEPELQIPPDIFSVIGKLVDGKVPVMAMDPVTAGFNFGTTVLLLVMKIIDTEEERGAKSVRWCARTCSPSSPPPR